MVHALAVQRPARGEAVDRQQGQRQTQRQVQGEQRNPNGIAQRAQQAFARRWGLA